MLLEMLLLNELEKAVCHCFCCVLAQSHIMRIFLAAFIVFSQLLLRFTGVLRSSAYGFALIVCLFIIANNLAKSITGPSAPFKGTHVKITIWGIRILRIFGYARIWPEWHI